MRCNGSNWAVYSPGSWDGFRNDVWALWAGVIMRLEHHLVGGYVRNISPHIIIIIIIKEGSSLVHIYTWSVYLDWSPVFILSRIETGSWRTIEGISLDTLCWRSYVTLRGSRAACTNQGQSWISIGGKRGGRTASVWRNSRASERDVGSPG